MPFRCKCGRTFEKPDSFASHTSGCALFHHRRMSDTNQVSTPQPVTAQPIVKTSFNNTGFLSSSPDSGRDISSSVPTQFFMPTALSLQNAFEGARRRSMSNGSSLK